MGKLTVAGASAGVLGTGGAATLGAHYMGAFGGGSEGPMYLAKTVKEFQEQNGGPCLEQTFSKIPESQKINNKKSNIVDVKSGDTKLGTGSKIGGCLVVNWDKYGGKKQDNFRFLGTLSRGDAGFAVYLTANLDSSIPNSPKLKFDGIAYTFEKKNGNWQTKKLNIKKGNNEISGSNIKAYFPNKKSSGFPTKISFDVNAYWNFLDKDGNVIKNTGNDQTQGRYFLGWDEQYVEDSIVNNYIQLGSPNLDSGWNRFFGKAEWDMLKEVHNIQGWWRDEKPIPPSS